MTDGAPEQNEAVAGVEPRRPLSRGDNPVVRAVGRLPVNVHVKLLIAFTGTALLLVAVGLIGQRVLGQSNDRVATLGQLQRRAIAYGSLQSDAAHVRLLLAENVDRDFYKVIRTPADLTSSPLRVNLAVANALARIRPATGVDALGFEPPVEDEAVLRQIRSTSTQLSRVMTEIVEFDRSAPSRGAPAPLRHTAEQLAIDLNQLATVLANATTAETDELIAQNARTYVGSRDLFIGVAACAIFLALLLGFVLSWSLVGPIQRIGARLDGIAAGDFSRHVDVTNRDELGALAANVNRMNDELSRVYGELEATSRHKSEFLANMSHELRTPLNAIIGFSQVLRERMFGDLNEKQEEYVDDVLASGNHLLALINDGLDLSKVEAGQVALEVAPFSLRDALESGVVMVRERAAKGGVNVALAANPDVEIEGDERRIRQVIFNLLANAVTFTPAGGAVDVSAATVDCEVRVSVRDTGPGIAVEDCERIFGEFQQAGAGGSQREGTGLGLALSRRLIELHGGRIWVDSTLGEGSTFVFTLPASAAS